MFNDTVSIMFYFMVIGVKNSFSVLRYYSLHFIGSHFSEPSDQGELDDSSTLNESRASAALILAYAAKYHLNRLVWKRSKPAVPDSIALSNHGNGHPMSVIVFFSFGASAIEIYEMNGTAFTAISVDGNNSIVFFWHDWGPKNETDSLVSVFLFPFDPLPSSVQIYDSHSTDPVRLTDPFFVYDPLPLRQVLVLYINAPMNFSIWTFKRPLCDSHVSVFGASGAARFRLNYNEDEARRCFFMMDTSTNNSFDYFVRSDSHHALPTLSVYTNWSITNSSAWIQTTGDVSKQLADTPIFFAVESVAEHSQWALNINFSHGDSWLAAACLFRGSPLFDGTNMTSSSDAGLDYRTQCTIPSSVTMWMYIWYTLFAGGSMVIIVLVGYWKFRQWQAEGIQVPSQKDYQPVFGNRAPARKSARQLKGPATVPLLTANAGAP
jgi:hypothetical protein